MGAALIRTDRETETKKLIGIFRYSVEGTSKLHFLFILLDPCIAHYSVEIPTRYSFVIEFVIPKFIEGSTCFERHTAHHQEL